jgi:hypothetical protein
VETKAALFAVGQHFSRFQNYEREKEE